MGYVTTNGNGLKIVPVTVVQVMAKELQRKAKSKKQKGVADRSDDGTQNILLFRFFPGKA
jgi:hypothetical protein